ncbi:MAG: homoserine O-succinyltransferase, partial [Clostridia bacterium]|nr:homoserine O-succinyltransferase [Clostridia bacterium]
ITGAPVETMPFEDVKYWEELKKIFDFADENVTSTIYICWGAQAALYYHYGIEKFELPEKVFGVFPHTRSQGVRDPLLKGIDDTFYIPHSRHTTVDTEAIKRVQDLILLSETPYTGASIIKSKDNKKIFLTGHMEYDRDTLKTEYERDLNKGLPIKPPYNYFTDETNTYVNVTWTSTANLFYTNWLNYYVYQVTPFKF